MRRSASQSNIPLPSNHLRVSAANKEKRSMSSSRDSTRSTSSHHEPVRQQSMVRESRSKLSFLRTPQPSTTPLLGKKSVTPLSLKLNKDKKVVSDLHAKVINFLRNSGLFNVEMIDPPHIQPPTIATFVYISSVFFKQIFPKLVITNENYKDVIPQNLKLLKFPGPITNTTLRMANTIHAFPQIIAIFAWLTDLVSITLNNEPLLVNELEENASKYCGESYLSFNNGNDDADDINKKYQNIIKSVIDFDEKKYNNLQKDLPLLRAQLDKRIRAKEKLELEEKSKLDYVNELKEKLLKLEETDDVIEFSLDKEILEFTQKRQNFVENISTKSTIIENHKKTISEQKTNPEEFSKLMQNMEDIKRRIEMKNSKNETWKEMKDNFDFQLAETIRAIENVVLEWNKSVIKQHFDNENNFEKLKVREQAFHEESFLTELDTIRNTFRSIYLEESSYVEKIERNLLEFDKCFKQKQEECEKLNEQHVIDLKTCEDIEVAIQDIKTKTSKFKPLLQEDKNHKDNFLSQLEKELVTLGDNCIDLAEKKLVLTNSLQKLCQDSVDFFGKINLSSKNYFQSMDNLRDQLLVSATRNLKITMEQSENIIHLLRDDN